MRRIILFDIDGTLLWGGPAKSAFVDAMNETYGTPGDIENVSFSGKTDPQIARELLVNSGVPHDEISRGLEGLFRRYLGYLEARLPEDPVTVLPGVPELLDALAAYDDVGVGLLTGNVAGGAKLKLASGGLWGRFDFGSYGSDHEHRDELPPIAVSRARELWGEVVTADKAIVVGDTPRDVQCGKAGGTRTMAVATGSFTAEELSVHDPDHVLEDFSSTTAVVDLLLG
ncbi:MAG: HAD family hydrolase [Gemmatimonadota bacterium]|nr:HAD family hydrolase [Gemmatimonadota bacterium]MDE3007295.1 HAD family hydrolase [Gemmatimonadota bacterium]MDE3014010.1 HAD family hydrolase [Gemmatimonadota bacterium]